MRNLIIAFKLWQTFQGYPLKSLMFNAAFSCVTGSKKASDAAGKARIIVSSQSLQKHIIWENDVVNFGQFKSN